MHGIANNRLVALSGRADARECPEGIYLRRLIPVTWDQRLCLFGPLTRTAVRRARTYAVPFVANHALQSVVKVS